QLVRADLLAVDVGPGGVLAVGDQDPVALHLDGAVDPADVQVVQADVGVPAAAADGDFHLLGQRVDAVLVGAVNDQQLHYHERPPRGLGRGRVALSARGVP